MTRRQRLSLALLMPVTLLLVGMLGAGLAQPVPDSPVISDSPQVNPARIISDTQTLAALAPERGVGSPGNAIARDWIIEQFKAMSLTVETLPFAVTVASQERPGAQVWVTAPGTSDDILLISARYDTPIVNSNSDNGYPAEGLATLLELARVLSTPPSSHQHTFLFMASDSVVYGPSWGAKTFLEQFPSRRQIIAVVDIDDRPPHSNLAGLWNGYAPLWLRQLKQSVFSAADVAGATEFFYRALPFQTGDAALYLRAGLPAIYVNSSHAPAIETLLRTIDTIDPLPTDSVNAPYWRISETHYLSNWVTPLLQLLLFAPLFVFTAIAYRKDRPREEELRPEFTAFMAWAVVGVDGYAIAFSLVAARLLPQYELFPAAPGDPFLLQPTGWAALAIYGTMAFMVWHTFWGWRGSGGWGRFADRLNIPHRQTTLLILLSGLALVTWFVNGFAAVVVFGLPAYLWPWIEPHRSLPGKIINTALALMGLLPLFFGLILVFGDPAFGPWWWFFPLGAAHGFFPLTTVIGFILFVALSIRFLRHGWR